MHVCAQGDLKVKALFNVDSLVATIKYHRSDLLVERKATCPVIPPNPHPHFFRGMFRFSVASPSLIPPTRS